MESMTLNSYVDGVIVRIISNLYTVKCGNVFVDCQARGKFRNMGLTPLVGAREGTRTPTYCYATP